MAQQKSDPFAQFVVSGPQNDPFAQYAASSAKPPQGNDAPDMLNWLQQQLERTASKVAGTPGSVMETPNVGSVTRSLVAPVVAGGLQTLAHPVDNAPLLLGMLGSFLPMPGTGAKLPSTLSGLARMGMQVAGKPGASAIMGRSLGAGAGGVLGGAIKERTPEGAAAHGLEQLALNLAGEGIASGIGGTLRGLGRAGGYKALTPSEPDKAAVWLAETGSPEGYLPVRGKRLIKDVMLERGEGNLGGETYAQSLKDRVTRGTAELDEIVNKTRSERGLPLPEYAVDRAEIARVIDPMAYRAGGPRGGSDPLAARAELEEVKNRFMRFDPASALPFESPRPMLTAGTPRTPLAGDDLGISVVEATPAAAIPNLERGPRVAEVAGETTPPQFLGEAARVAPTATQPTQAVHLGGVKLPPPTQDWTPADLDLLARTQPSPPTPTTLTSASDLLDARRELDNELQATMQRNVGATGKMSEYVMSPSEQGMLAIRRAAQDKLNAIMPPASSGRTMAEINPQVSRDIVWRDMAARATNDDTSGLRASARVNKSGTPGLSLFENIYRFGGAAARPIIRTGEAMQRTTALSPALARLAMLLSANPVEAQETNIRPNLKGFGGQ